MIKIHPGYLRLLVADKEYDSWDTWEFEMFRDPDNVIGASGVSVVGFDLYDEYGYGIREMLLLRSDDTGHLYGRLFYRGLGKHDDDNNEFFEETFNHDPSDMDEEDLDVPEEDWLEFHRVVGIDTIRYDFAKED
jgi:hypothetical protein